MNQGEQAVGALARCQSDDTLRETDRRLHWALQAAGGGAWDWDLKGGEAWWSAEMYALWGAAPGTPMRLDNSLALVLEQDRERLRDAVATAIARRTDYHCEFRIQHPTRGERWIASQGRLILDTNGEPVCLSGLSFDITERKQAEAAQRLSEERLLRVCRAGGIGLYEWRPGRGDTYWSPETYALFGIDPQTPAGYEPWIASVHPDDRASVEHTLAAMLEPAGTAPGADTYRHEFRVLHPDGSLRWLAATTTLARDGDDILLCGVVRDITARRQVEEDLRRSECELQALADHSPDLIGRVDRQLRHVFVSRVITRITGKSVTEYLGKTNEELGYPPALCAAWSAHLNAVFRTGQPRELEFDFASPAGLLHFSHLAVPEFAPDGSVEAVVFVARDVTRLKQAQERARLALEAGHMATWDSRLSDGVTMWNDAHYRILGLRPGEVTPGYAAWAAAVHPQDRAEIAAAYQRSLDEGGDYTGEFRVIWPDGTLHWLETRGRTERDGAGRPARSYGVLLDQTARKRTAEALRLSEEKLRLAQRVAQIGTFDWDIQTGINTWTPELEAMYGLPPGGFANSQPAWEDLLHPEDRAAATALVKQSFATLEPTAGEWRVCWPDGSVHWLSGRWRTFTDAAGRPVRMLGINIDITARKQVEQDLRESEMRYRMLHENLRDAFVQVAMDGRIVDCNEVYCRMLGYSPAELEALSYRDLTPARWHAVEDAIVREQILPHGYSEVYEKEYVRKDGTRVPVELRTILSRDAAGQPAGMWAIVRDITARKEAEATLREADRRKEAFIAILAHELRNPLAPIRNAVEILKLTGSPDPTQQAARDMIERQVRHLVRLVDDLLDVSRINQGRLQLRRERVALATILDQVLQSARPQVEQVGHRLTATLPDTSLMLDADPVRLAQVFHNLLDNACKYSEPGGLIRVSAERAGAQVVVRVADRGIGIAPADLPRLFELFVQAGTPSGQMPAGLGIGLALCRGLVELHGGSIEARSAGPGQGAEFSVFLPAVPDAPAAPAPAPARPPTGPATPVRVLVVDDNLDSAESLAFLLRASGYAVTTAHDGLAGFEAAARERPEILLLDLGMPRLDGYDACRRIRAEPWGRALRIIALTGWGQADDRRRIEAAGFDLHLVKPIELSALLGFLADSPTGQATIP